MEGKHTNFEKKLILIKMKVTGSSILIKLYVIKWIYTILSSGISKGIKENKNDDERKEKRKEKTPFSFTHY